MEKPKWVVGLEEDRKGGTAKQRPSEMKWELKGSSGCSASSAPGGRTGEKQACMALSLPARKAGSRLRWQDQGCPTMAGGGGGASGVDV